MTGPFPSCLGNRPDKATASVNCTLNARPSSPLHSRRSPIRQRGATSFRFRIRVGRSVCVSILTTSESHPTHIRRKSDSPSDLIPRLFQPVSAPQPVCSTDCPQSFHACSVTCPGTYHAFPTMCHALSMDFPHLSDEDLTSEHAPATQSPRIVHGTDHALTPQSHDSPA